MHIRLHLGLHLCIQRWMYLRLHLRLRLQLLVTSRRSSRTAVQQSADLTPEEANGMGDHMRVKIDRRSRPI